mgnify:CR=1 FL=1
MRVIAGELSVLLNGENDWKVFPAGTSFKVEGDSKFKVRMTKDVAYLCEYA